MVVCYELRVNGKKFMFIVEYVSLIELRIVNIK